MAHKLTLRDHSFTHRVHNLNQVTEIEVVPLSVAEEFAQPRPGTRGVREAAQHLLDVVRERVEADPTAPLIPPWTAYAELQGALLAADPPPVASTSDVEEQYALLQARCYEGFPSATDGIFDAYAAMQEQRHDAESLLEDASALIRAAFAALRPGDDDRRLAADLRKTDDRPPGYYKELGEALRQRPHDTRPLSFTAAQDAGMGSGGAINQQRNADGDGHT